MLVTALYLDPGLEDDPFGRFIEAVCSGWDISEGLRRFLGYLYWVDPT
jgi:hypothetical protein